MQRRMARIGPVAPIEVVGDGSDQLNAVFSLGSQIDRLHPSFGVALASGNPLWRSRVDAPEIILG